MIYFVFNNCEVSYKCPKYCRNCVGNSILRINETLLINVFLAAVKLAVLFVYLAHRREKEKVVTSSVRPGCLIVTQPMEKQAGKEGATEPYTW